MTFLIRFRSLSLLYGLQSTSWFLKTWDFSPEFQIDGSVLGFRLMTSFINCKAPTTTSSFSKQLGLFFYQQQLGPVSRICRFGLQSPMSSTWSRLSRFRLREGLGKVEGGFLRRERRSEGVAVPLGENWTLKQPIFSTVGIKGCTQFHS